MLLNTPYRKVPYVKDEIITLRAMEEEDVEQVGKWRFDPDNYDYFYEFVPVCKLKK